MQDKSEKLTLRCSADGGHRRGLLWVHDYDMVLSVKEGPVELN
jgi:hypothetical protein